MEWHGFDKVKILEVDSTMLLYIIDHFEWRSKDWIAKNLLHLSE